MIPQGFLRFLSVELGGMPAACPRTSVKIYDKRQAASEE